MTSDSITSPRPWKRRRVLDIMPSGSMLKDLLASFAAHKSHSPRDRMIGEDNPRNLRQRTPPRYADSEDSISPCTEKSTSSYDDSHETPTPEDDVDVEMNDASSVDELQDEDVIHVAPRRTSAALAAEHKTKQQSQRRVSISKPTRDLPRRTTRSSVPNYYSPVNISGTPTRTRTRLLWSDTDTPPKKARKVKKPAVETARTRVRDDIAVKTKPKRDTFLFHNRNYFKPLLPENSYISKLERNTWMEEADVVPREFIDDQPSGVQAVMKPYQLEGLSFLVHMYKNGMSAILGDEMGLGKTLQTLSLFQWLAENEPTQGESRPHLVVCPLSVLSSWMAESRKWIPDLNVIRFHGPKAERDRLKQRCLEMKQSKAGERIDVIVTTYETFVSEQNWFKRIFVWRFCVLDEGHKIKNDKSNMSTALQSLSAEFRLLLTGTPLQNDLYEMWCLLHWLFPEVFTHDTADRFKKSFNLTNGTVSTNFMDDARHLLELIMVRRMKTSAGVNLGLPPKEEVLLYVPLTPMQRFWYTRMLTRSSADTLDDLFKDTKAKEELALERENAGDLKSAHLKTEDAVATNADVWAETKAIMEAAAEKTENVGDWKKLMNLLMQLRKICIHPYMLRDAAPEEYTIGEHIKIASGKFIVLEKLINELVIEKGKKILIFSGFTSTLSLVEELLFLKGANASGGEFRFSRLDGSTPRAQRNLTIRLFNDMSSDVQVMLLSTRAGGLGINLTSATDVIFMDEDWNPQITLQAEARAHRIGQTQKVTIYKICTQGTVEEQMMGRIRKKLYLSAKITESMRNIHAAASTDGKSKKRKRTSTADGGEMDDAPQLDTASLQSLIRRGAQTLARPEINIEEMLGWDWETTLEKCKDKPIDNVNTLADPNASTSEADELTWLNTMERVETAIFEGRAHQKRLESQASSLLLPSNVSRADRRTDKNTTVQMNGFAISKESLLCGDWEAVPTLAGKDPTLASPKRERRKPIPNHQSHCQICWDGGDLVLCSACPRAYHPPCLSPEARVKAASGAQFHCPQHECRDCGAKTAEAGGMIYRCRWCEAGFCEDCLEWDLVKLQGDGLPELEMLGFGKVAQAHWLESCRECVRVRGEDREDDDFVEGERARIEREYEVWKREGELGVLLGADEREMDTPATVSEVGTPRDEVPGFVIGGGKKLKGGKVKIRKLA